MTSRSINYIGGFGLMAVGLAFVIGAFGYEFGTSSRIGPGYFPLVIGSIVILLGATIAFSGIPAEDNPGQEWRPILSVLASILLFAAVIGPFGFLPAVFVAVAVSAIGDNTAGLGRLFVLAVAATGAAWLIFSVGLRLPYDLIKAPF